MIIAGSVLEHSSISLLQIAAREFFTNQALESLMQARRVPLRSGL